MNAISRLIYASMAAILAIGIVGCTTTKEQPAPPPAPEPVVEVQAEPAPEPAAEPAPEPEPVPVLAPKPDRG